jgi:hypothetical protein
VRARLLWRLLVVPRLILAVGVIIVALVVALMPRRRRSRPVRRPPTSEDPVADALADAGPVSRFAGEELDVNDLRSIISVDELEPVDEVGHNVVVSLDDDVWSYADVDADGLEAVLAEQPGIDSVDVDGEVVLLRSMLSLPDVHAATVRALLTINQSPRLHQLPRYRPLPPSVLRTVADGVTAMMAGHGFVGRLMGHEPDESLVDDLIGPGFYRFFPEDRLVQVVRLENDYGYRNSDGTILSGQLQLTVEVIELATTEVAESIERDRACEVVAGERILSISYQVPATVDGVAQVFMSKALPLCESTTSRSAIVDRWVSGLPWYVPDRLRWEAADIAARWGFRSHARDLVRYGARRLPQVATVAAKHRL